MVDPAALGLTEEDVELIVKRYLQEKRDRYNAKFRVLSYHVKRLSEEPIGYLGDHYFLNVVLREKMVHYSAEEEEYAEEEYLSFFLKILPEQVPKLADYVREMGCFRKEIQLYTHLIPRLQDVTIGTKPFAPRAYLTKDEKLLVFENLKAEGYRMLENNKSLLDFAHLEVALKTVAKLHAASLVLEERTKQSIMKLYSGHLNENVYIDDDTYVRKTNLDNAIKALCELIKRIDKYKNSDKLDFILAKFPEVIRRIYDFARPSTEYRNVFNHGDLWNNNLMFKYDEPETSAPNSDPGACSGEGGAAGHQQEHQPQGADQSPPSCSIHANVSRRTGQPIPTAGILLDYQLSRYAPPALDVFTVITLGSESEFRAKHQSTFLDAYYEALRAELAQNQLDIGQIIPRSDFDASCDYYELAGLVESCLFNMTILVPMEIAKPLMDGSAPFDDFIRDERTKVRLIVESFEIDATFRHRFTDILSEIIDKYVLGGAI
ncbi:AAEL006600-PC [Aedes aegypti]|uniref:AAEL006600-PC n=1 Tax=Aedes aegypti TaxID=7159 RepID=Q175M5_AEDAE|nr:AAEL006600-PC [Aedes aegypti]